MGRAAGVRVLARGAGPCSWGSTIPSSMTAMQEDAAAAHKHAENDKPLDAQSECIPSAP